MLSHPYYISLSTLTSGTHGSFIHPNPEPCGANVEHILGLSVSVGVAGQWQGWRRLAESEERGLYSLGMGETVFDTWGSEEGVTLKEYGPGFLPLLPHSLIFLCCKSGFCTPRPHYLGHYGAIIF